MSSYFDVLIKKGSQLILNCKAMSLFFPFYHLSVNIVDNSIDLCQYYAALVARELNAVIANRRKIVIKYVKKQQ